MHYYDCCFCRCHRYGPDVCGYTGTYDLATHVMAGGDYANTDGTTGRKVTIAEQAAITVDHTGTALGVMLGISASSTIVYVTTCTSQSLTAGNTVTVPAWTITVGDPT
ncbi:MAG: hypothetical protein MZV63_15640 [Marinilabiliales bacterium]|nr:hypothetical protein [Marinilabiliales bacterium]